MRILTVWVGWGLGDNSLTDETVRRAKAFMRAMYRSYAGHLPDTNIFDDVMAATVFEMQRRLLDSGKLKVGHAIGDSFALPLPEGHFIWGVLDLNTQTAMGFKKPKQQPLPIIFTVEGHMSNPFVGPCAFVAQTLEAQGVCHWKPVGYNNTAMPFDNESGVRELARLYSSDRIEGPIDPNTGQTIWWDFGPEVSSGIIDFSQGAIVGNEFKMRYLLSGPLTWREPKVKRSLSFGNPYRELDQIAPWVPDPPKPGTAGISDRRFNVAGTPFGEKHREHSRHGDIYAENEQNEAGEKKTAIYKAVQGKFTGRGSLLNEALEIFTDPMSQVFPVTQAIWSGGMFLFNMGPHGMYDLAPCVEWMRGVKS